ncbi:MAG: FAD-dependent oxidoreductase [Actinomycetota bacterium]
MEHHPVVVVGAGLAGLTAANHLLDAGRAVTVIETRSHVGGRARTDTVDGFRLNLGPHALYRDGHGMHVLRELDIETSGWNVPLDDSAAVVDDRLALLPVGPTSLLRTRWLGWRGKLRVGRLLGGLPSLDASAWASTTVDDFLASEVPEPRAADLVRALARLTTYSNRPDIASAGALIEQLQGATGSGVRYLHGGWQGLADQLRDRALHRGADVRTGVAVQDLRRTDAGFVVETDAPLRAGTVVLAVAPAAADRLLGGGTGLVEAAGPEVVASVLDLGLDRVAGRRFVLGVDRPHYLSRHAPAAELAPEGASLVSAMRYGEPEAGPREGKAVLLDLADRAGIAPQRIVMERYLHRVVVAGGLPLAARGGLAGRPGVEVPGVPGAFVAGDWVGGDGVLADAALASGRAAARAIIGRAAPTATVGTSAP